MNNLNNQELKSFIRSSVKTNGFITSLDIKDKFDVNIISPEFQDLIESLIKMKILQDDVIKMKDEETSEAYYLYIERGTNVDELKSFLKENMGSKEDITMNYFTPKYKNI